MLPDLMLPARRGAPAVQIDYLGYSQSATGEFTVSGDTYERCLLVLPVGIGTSLILYSLNITYPEISDDALVKNTTYTDGNPAAATAALGYGLIRQPRGCTARVNVTWQGTPAAAGMFVFEVTGLLDLYSHGAPRPLFDAHVTANNTPVKVGHCKGAATFFLSVCNAAAGTAAFTGATKGAEIALGSAGKAAVASAVATTNGETEVTVNWSGSPSAVATIALTYYPKRVSTPGYAWKGKYDASFAAKDSHTFTNVDIGAAADDRFLIIACINNGSSSSFARPADFQSAYKTVMPNDNRFVVTTYKRNGIIILPYPREVTATDILLNSTGMTYATIGVWVAYGLGAYQGLDDGSGVAATTADINLDALSIASCTRYDDALAIVSVNSNDQATDYSMSGWSERADAANGSMNYAFYDAISPPYGGTWNAVCAETVSSSRQLLAVTAALSELADAATQTPKSFGADVGGVCTIANLKLGHRRPGRRVVAVFVHWISAAGVTLNAATIAGVSATIVGEVSSGGTNPIKCACAYVELNNYAFFGDVQFTFSGAVTSGGAVAMNLANVATTHSDTATASVQSGTSIALGGMDIPAMGVGIAGYFGKASNTALGYGFAGGDDQAYWSGANIYTNAIGTTAQYRRATADLTNLSMTASRSETNANVAVGVSFARSL